jgi:protein arginine kinase activator
MKLCDECGVNPANIHLTQIMQNATQVSHLCEECARKKGISVTITEEEPVVSGARNGEAVIDITCKQCGCTYEQFRSKGWLGCPDCYNAFEKEIDTLLMQMHGSLIHKGKRYHTPGGSSQELTVEMKRLRQELAVAIKNEEFEQAATIRDAIHSIKQMGVQ